MCGKACLPRFRKLSLPKSGASFLEMANFVFGHQLPKGFLLRKRSLRDSPQSLKGNPPRVYVCLVFVPRLVRKKGTTRSIPDASTLEEFDTLVLTTSDIGLTQVHWYLSFFFSLTEETGTKSMGYDILFFAARWTTTWWMRAV
jgi:hypothetical protein